MSTMFGLYPRGGVIGTTGGNGSGGAGGGGGGGGGDGGDGGAGGDGGDGIAPDTAPSDACAFPGNFHSEQFSAE